MINERLLVALTTNRFATWYIKHIASRLDPIVFKATNGRFTSMGPSSSVIPMLTFTAIGRQSGQPRSVQVACVPHEGDYLITASAMGQAKHPAWKSNIDANSQVTVQITGERFDAVAEKLTDDEKALVWNKIRKTIPQMNVYVTRTDRNICVYRLRRV